MPVPNYDTPEVKILPDESRQQYLARVMVTYLRKVPLMSEGIVNYDEADCDGLCLADDIVSSFNLTDILISEE